MSLCLTKDFFKEFRSITALLFVGISLFSSIGITSTVASPGPISGVNDSPSTAIAGGLPENIFIDSSGQIIQELSHNRTKMIGQAIATMLARPTALVKLSGNLNAREPVSNDFSTAQLLSDPHNPAFTKFSVGLRVFDSLGIGHDLTVFFSKIAQNRWLYSVVAYASEVTVTIDNSDPGTRNALVAQGRFGFDSNGLLDMEEAAQFFNELGNGIDFSNGATKSQAIVIDFGTSITTDGGAGSDGMLQQGVDSVLLTLSQDGFPRGLLNGMVVAKSGEIVGRYSNGQTQVLGQVLSTVARHPNKKKRTHDKRHRKQRNKRNDSVNREISGTMNAVQQGVWTVGQFGAWHVNVDNNSEHPVAVQDVSLSKRMPWAHTQSIQFQHDKFSAENVFLTVPAGRRLVIQHLSLEATVEGRLMNNDTPQVMASMHTTFNASPITYQLGLSDVFRIDKGDLQEVRHVLSKSIRLYTDKAAQVQINIDRNFAGNHQEGTVSMTGYLEEIP